MVSDIGLSSLFVLRAELAKCVGYGRYVGISSNWWPRDGPADMMREWFPGKLSLSSEIQEVDTGKIIEPYRRSL